LIRGRLRVRLLVAIWAVVSIVVWTSLAIIGRDAGSAGAIVVALVAGGLSAFVLSELAMRWTEATMKPLADAARRMHEGDLDARVRVASEEDVGQVGAVFDELATSFSHTVSELRSERDLVARILDGMQEGVLLLDKGGKVALMNPALREMLLLRADALGQPLLEVVRHAELKELLDRARTTKTTCSGEVELGGLKPRRLLVRGGRR
jgi:two-component system phosphate regulon sensor histidine kinase PhoR